MDPLGLELAYIWNAKVIGSSLICYGLAPEKIFFWKFYFFHLNGIVHEAGGQTERPSISWFIPWNGQVGKAWVKLKLGSRDFFQVSSVGMGPKYLDCFPRCIGICPQGVPTLQAVMFCAVNAILKMTSAPLTRTHRPTHAQYTHGTMERRKRNYCLMGRISIWEGMIRAGKCLVMTVVYQCEFT